MVGQVVPERSYGEGAPIPAPIMQQAVLMDSHARFDATLMDKDVEPEEIRLLAARPDMTKGGTGGSVVSHSWMAPRRRRWRW